MKKNILKLAACSLLAMAIVIAPALSRAADASTNAPTSMPGKHKKHDIIPFSGKLSAVDKDAMTLTVGERTFEITSATKITKDGVPATLADGIVGETVGGAYKKTEDGKLTATSIHFGVKSKTKSKSSAANSGTNSVNQ